MKFVQMMMEKGFNIDTIATTVGLHHPFFDMADVDTLKTKWVSTNVTQSEIDQQIALISPWTVWNDSKLGMKSCITKKNMLQNIKLVDLQMTTI